jgi:phosphoribosylamine--glycine ligase
VVLADGDYPVKTTPGRVIHGVDAAAALDDVFVYQAGTRMQDGELVTAGGRVLCVTGLGDGLEAARATAYDAIQRITFEGMRFRTDIGWRELNKSQPLPSR